MTVRFKNLYREYMGKGVPSSDFGEFKKELGNMPDEELWNTMMDMEKESVTEIGMPPMMKKQIRKELHQIIWRRRWIQFAKYAAVIALLFCITRTEAPSGTENATFLDSVRRVTSMV